MKNKLSYYISVSAVALYAVLFSGVFLSITFKNVIFTYRIPLQLGLIGILTVLLVFFIFVYKRVDHILIKYRYLILAIFCLFVFSVQMVISLNMVPNVMYDHDKTLNAAIVYVLEGNSKNFQLYNNYLHHYPHQMGIFLIQYTVFKLAAIFGFTNYFLIACVIGHLMFMVMNIAAFIYLDENCSAHRGLFYLIIAGIYIPMYFQSSISYTDTYSAWAPACLLLFGTRALKENNKNKRIIYAMLTGILAGVAMQVKTTAVFVLLAIAIQVIVKGLKKKHSFVMIIVFGTMMITNVAFESWSYSTVLEEYRDGESMPLTHWIMMGLQGDGSYSGYDEWSITCAVPPEQRVEKNIEIIKERLEEMGIAGYLKLLYTKTCRTFGSGNADLRYSFKYEEDYNPSSLLYHLVFENGKYYFITNNISNAVYLLINLLGIIGSGIILVKNREKACNFTPYLALCGFWLFMMLWESSHRQLINQWSLYFIVAALGIYEIYHVFKSDNQMKNTHSRNQLL